jgi:hypothetical protein
MRNLTPSHLRCGTGLCPSITQLEDGRLLIVGQYNPSRARMANVSLGEDEAPVVISPDLLADYISQHVDAAVRAERESCMAAICVHCRNGLPVIMVNTNQPGHEDRDGTIYFCDATAIRSRGNNNGGEHA